ncbi:hypothetical protein EFP84_18830 [Leptospira kmetyi]|uniref:Uncharacterized protein n=1 Tax=Leptospira kmetyi TaxID=408139 RepID=A0AAD0XRT2_9LEPT|nr:hypothetical protein [Leptospira kmetyi]AYV57697.1 hypothetical protein EFP84_18830 [Leptospira kmetyi]
MSKFRTEKPIPPVHIDKDLLMRLEAYFIKVIPDLIPGFPKNKRKAGYSVEITDKYGTEEFESFAEYDFKYLPDTISLIQIGLIDENEEFHIDLILDKDEGGSLEIEFESKNARERSISLIEGIEKIIGNYKTPNRFFHPPQIVHAVLIIAGIVYGLQAVDAFRDNKYLDMIGPGFIALSIGSYYYVGKYIRTVVSFETKRYQVFNHYLGWFISGCFSFLIFGTAFTYFKDKLLKIILK